MSRVSTSKRILFALFALVLLPGAIEGLLRVIGFRYQRTMAYMEFNFPEPHTLHNIFQPDKDLLWKMRPGYRMGEGFPPLNEQGFRGREFKKEKPPELFRVACLGDSVTFGGVEASFPQLLEKYLRDNIEAPVEVMNFGVPGYSSFQGRKLAEKVLDKYRPDAVVILFGWNDHWLAMGFSDHEQEMDRRRGGLVEALRKVRLYQLVNRAVAALCQQEKKPLVLRVPPEKYEANLKAMAAKAKQTRAAVILATAPSAIETGRMPPYLVHNWFVKSRSELKTLHEKYNRIVRETARQKDLPLVDFVPVFRKHGVKSLFEDPANDIIHPNATGYELMAREIGRTVLQNK